MTDYGRKPRLEWLPIARLVVDHTYQRTVESLRSQRLIANITASFRWSLFQAAVVTAAGGGQYAVIDGQHRIEAAKRRNIDEIPAVVIETADAAEAARAFVAANRDRVNINPLQIHHALLAAGDEWARRVKRVCDRAGVAVLKTTVPVGNMKPGETLAIGTIGNLIREHGDATAADALRLLKETYATRGGLIRSIFIKAVAVLLAGGEMPGPAIAAVLRKATQTTLHLEAARRVEEGAKNIARGLADEIAHRAEKKLAGAVKDEKPIRPEGAPRSLKTSIARLAGQGFKTFPGTEKGTYRIGDVDGFSAEDLVAYAAMLAEEKPPSPRRDSEARAK